MDITTLEEIGLTKSEIKVYLALLKIGQTTAGPIVDESRITRSKIYDILERLKHKGLVSYITKNATKYFSAADPTSILEYLNDKEESIKKEKRAVEKILPELLLYQTLAKEKSVAEIFIGMKGMENAFNKIVREFNAKEPYYAFGAGKGENISQIQLFFSRLHAKRTAKNVTSMIIFNESSRGLFKTQEQSKLAQVRYMRHSTPAAINIYKEYTIIAILNQEPITLLIKNKDTADSFKEYFKLMWENSKK